MFLGVAGKQLFRHHQISRGPDGGDAVSQIEGENLIACHVSKVQHISGVSVRVNQTRDQKFAAAVNPARTTRRADRLFAASRRLQYVHPR